MSLVGLLAVAKAVVNYKKFGPPMDEYGPWHVFVLMMFLQLPIILYFIIIRRRELRGALRVLAVQLSLWGIGMGAAFYLPGIY